MFTIFQKNKKLKIKKKEREGKMNQIKKIGFRVKPIVIR
jgi:hypothetical protein